MFKKPPCLPRPDEQWLPEHQLTNADELLTEYKLTHALDTGQLFEVEKILGKKLISGTMHYHVKWKGYRAHKTHWEPASNLTGASALINAFNKKQSGTAPPKKRRKRKRKVHAASGSDDSEDSDYA